MAIAGLAALGAPVRGRVVAKYLGLLCLSLAAMAAVPGAVAAALGEAGFALRCLVVAAALVAAGAPAARLPAATDMRANEALTVTALTFVLAALAMSWPFMAAGLPFADALFEATSGVTTTGLTMLGDPSARSPALLFARAWLQWYGGLAIVVLALALMTGPGLVARRLEDGGTPAGDLVASTRLRSRRLLGVYAALTAAGVALLWLAGLAPFDAVAHALSAVSTGGFSSRPEALAAGAPGAGPLQASLALLSLAGAISFALQYRAWRGEPARLWRDGEVRALLAAILLVTLLLWLGLALAGPDDGAGGLRTAGFLAVSAHTTAGFASGDLSGLDPASSLTLIAAMIVGGDAGSTAGGLKIVRLLIILRLVHLAVARTCLPRHAMVAPRPAGHPIDVAELSAVLAFLALYLAAIALSWLAFLLMGQPPLPSLFEVVSALGTVGLSSGLTNPDLPAALKFVLGLDMLLGRLEIIALLVLVYHRTWIGRRSPE